jgi:hypothetical protein
MEIDHGGRGKGMNPDIPKTQPPAEQQAVEHAGKIPPLHPIFERLSHTLNQQQAAEEKDRRERRQVSERERKRRWRRENPDKHRAWERTDKRRAYKAAWIRNYRRRQKEAKKREETGVPPNPSA